MDKDDSPLSLLSSDMEPREKITRWTEQGVFSTENIMSHMDRSVLEWYGIHEDELQALSKTLSDHNGVLTEDHFIQLFQRQAGGEDVVPRQVGSFLYHVLAYLSQVPFIDSSSPRLASLDEKQLRRAICWLLPERHDKAIINGAERGAERTKSDHRRLLFRSMAAAAAWTTGVETTAPTASDDAEIATDEEGDTRLSEVLDVLYGVQPACIPFVCVRRHEFLPLARQMMEGKSSRLRDVQVPRHTLAALSKVMLALQLHPSLNKDGENLEKAAWEVVATMACDEDESGGNGFVKFEGFEEGLVSMPQLFEPLYRVVPQALFSGLIPHNFLDPEELFDEPSMSYSTSVSSIHYPTIYSLARAAQLNLFFSQSVWHEEHKVYLYHSTTSSTSSATPPPTPSSLTRALTSVGQKALLLLRGRDANNTSYIVGVYSPYPKADRAAIQPAKYSNSCRCGTFVLEPLMRFHEEAEGVVGWEEEEDEVRFCGGRLVVRKGEGEDGLKVRLRTGRLKHEEGSCGGKPTAVSVGVESVVEVEIEGVEVWGCDEEEVEEGREGKEDK